MCIISTVRRFRDNNESKVNWQEFPDYDTIFTDVATKAHNAEKVNTHSQAHSMTMSDMHEMHGFNDDFSFGQRPSLTPSTPSSFISSQFPSPPPLPIIDNDSTKHDKLNDDFWSDLIDAATPCMYNINICVSVIPRNYRRMQLFINSESKN